MKFLATLLFVALAMMAAVHAQMQVRIRPPRSVFPPRDRPFGPSRPRDRPFRPLLPRPIYPTLPIFVNRYPRSISKDGGISWSVNGQKKIYGNKHGSIHVSGGIGSQDGGRPRGNIEIGGGFNWKG